ncbi:glycosyltransferase [Marinoscillum sp. MHG1-6]|uniref:glycosyltransferase n=1 Tax=Marinoscillum sp. MHG1-6 TaxID=2959627 RepID=UPI0021578194|nr:glycosyltransferase [Marinoscillum sp. MHG1-6]
MNILILTTFEKSGGAGIAANRLAASLKNSGFNVKLAYALGDSSGEGKVNMTNSFFLKASFWWNFISERVFVRSFISKKKYLYKFSLGKSGLNLSRNLEVAWADVIHIHWVNFGFVSLEEIYNLSKIKPIIWTFHDFWPITGGCHIPLSCELFKDKCQSCFYTSKPSDRAEKQLNEKTLFFKKFRGQITVVSHWLKEQVLAGKVLKDRDVRVLGNSLNTKLYHPIADKVELRYKFNLSPEKFIIVAGAADLNDEIKGFSFLIETLKILDGLDDFSCTLILFGRGTHSLNFSNIEIRHVGAVASPKQMCEIYNLGDCFVLSSIQETLSYTTMEAMACGIPVVCFDAGGVTDLLIHGKTGYLSKLRDSKDLAKGIFHFYTSPDLRREVSEQCRKHVANNYDEQVVSLDYYNLYQEVLAAFKSKNQG